jgi:two-component system, OmpR family, response regulator
MRSLNPEKRILVASGSPAVGRLIRDALAWDGHAVELLASLRELLEAVDDDRHALLVLDDSRCDVPAETWVRRLRARGLRLPLLVLSGTEGMGYLERAEGLRKPFDLEELRAQVALMIGPCDRG